MTRIGYTLSSEEHGPLDLVRRGVRAEEVGFDFVSVSDHYHPWTTEQGHSPFVWSVLGALATSTSELRVAVGVTCPTVRIHPAVIAQASATSSLLFGDRFTLGVGSGEALNEHITGERWPPPETRLAMLTEAVEIIRRLWSAETVDHRGRFYEVDNARLFDAPETDPELVVSGFGPAAVDLAAEIGDGYWGSGPGPDTVDRYRAAGGVGPAYAQVNVCWAPEEDRARETSHRVWPQTALGGQLAQDLPTWTHFEDASSVLTAEQTTSSVTLGPDVDRYVEVVAEFAEAGYDHVYLHQIGEDQEGFLDFFDKELRDALGERLSG